MDDFKGKLKTIIIDKFLKSLQILHIINYFDNKRSFMKLK